MEARIWQGQMEYWIPIPKTCFKRDSDFQFGDGWKAREGDNFA